MYSTKTELRAQFMAPEELALAYFNSRVVPLENILMVRLKGSLTSQLSLSRWLSRAQNLGQQAALDYLDDGWGHWEGKQVGAKKCHSIQMSLQKKKKKTSEGIYFSLSLQMTSSLIWYKLILHIRNPEIYKISPNRVSIAIAMLFWISMDFICLPWSWMMLSKAYLF